MFYNNIHHEKKKDAQMIDIDEQGGRGKQREMDDHNLSSLAIFEAIFLKPIDVPEMRLNLTPLSDNLGSLHTSISHCTRESVLGSPCTQSNRNFSRCS